MRLLYFCSVSLAVRLVKQWPTQEEMWHIYVYKLILITNIQTHRLDPAPLLCELNNPRKGQLESKVY
jgi:hypothetical protein